MADNRGLVDLAGAIVADGQWKGAREARDGSLIQMPWKTAAGLAGRIFTANMGSVVTALTFLITGANRPDAWIRVPAGTLIVPLKVGIAFNSMAGTVTMVDVRSAQNDIGNGTSTAATVGPENLRTDSPFASNCIARQLATADVTAETNPVSLFRYSYIRADDAGSNEKNLHIPDDEMGNPVLMGPASWEVYIQATTTQATGFVVMTWAEYPIAFAQ